MSELWLCPYCQRAYLSDSGPQPCKFKDCASFDNTEFLEVGDIVNTVETFDTEEKGITTPE